MTHEVLQYLLSGLLFLSAFIYDSARKNWSKIDAPDREYKDQADFAKAVADMSGTSDSGKVLLDNTTALYKTFRENIQIVETKLGTLLGFIGGGSGIFALVTGSGLVATPVFTPLLGLAILFLLAGFCCALGGLRPARYKNVDVGQLSDPALMKSPNGPAQMSARMGWEYLEASRLLIPTIRIKARWLKRCYNAFTLGVVCLILNAIIPVEKTPVNGAGSVNVNIHCDIIQKNQLNCSLKPLEISK